jgi:N-acyl-D-amino-acid deacylase
MMSDVTYFSRSLQVTMLERNQSDENLRQSLCHPQSTVIGDRFHVKARRHPRLHGTFPLLLGKCTAIWVG